MEYTQWGKQKLKSLSSGVLILVVMEYTQWETKLKSLSSGIPES